MRCRWIRRSAVPILVMCSMCAPAVAAPVAATQSAALADEEARDFQRSINILQKPDASSDLKNSACDAIAHLGARGSLATPELISCLADEAVRDHARAALLAIGEPAVPLLQDALKTSDPLVRNGAVIILLQIGHPQTKPPTLPADADAEPSRETIQLEALRRWQAERRLKRDTDLVSDARPVLTMSAAGQSQLSALTEVVAGKGLEAADPAERLAVRAIAASQLSRIGYSGAAIPLLDVIRDPSDPLGEAAVGLLNRFRHLPESAVPDLAKLLSAPEDNLRLRAVRALREIGPLGVDAIPALLTALKDPYSAVSQGAADALTTVGPANPDSVLQLVAAVSDKDLSVRRVAVRALAWASAAAPDDPRVRSQAVIALAGAMGDDDAAVRETAATGLRAMGFSAGAAVLPMIDLLMEQREKHPGGRRLAVAVLESMGSAAKEAAPTLATLVRAGSRGAEDLDLTSTAASALAKVAPETSETIVTELVDVLKQAPPPGRAGPLLAALRGFGPAAARAAPVLLDRLTESPHDTLAAPDPRVPVLQAIGAIGPGARSTAPNLVPALVQLSEGGPSPARAAAAAALAQVDPAEALVGAVRRGDSVARGTIALHKEFLYLSPAATDILIGKLTDLAQNDPDPAVRTQARGALLELRAQWAAATKPAPP